MGLAPVWTLEKKKEKKIWEKQKKITNQNHKPKIKTKNHENDRKNYEGLRWEGG